MLLQQVGQEMYICTYYICICSCSRWGRIYIYVYIISYILYIMYAPAAGGAGAVCARGALEQFQLFGLDFNRALIEP
jgi:hypothetical protein